MSYNDAVSTAQINFIQTLAAARTEALKQHPAVLSLPCTTKRDASRLIDALKTLPVDPDPSVPEVVAKALRKGSNSRAGTCSSCNGPVAADAGYWYTKVGGGFAEHHKVGECVDPATVVTPVQQDITEGFWHDGDLYVHVYVTRYGHLGGKALSERGDWVYTPGILNRLRHSATASPVAPEQALNEVCIRKYGAPLGSEELRIKAAEYGAKHSSCIFCARALTDERSDPALGGVGYGPECASKYGLPWGNVTLTK